MDYADLAKDMHDAFREQANRNGGIVLPWEHQLPEVHQAWQAAARAAVVAMTRPAEIELAEATSELTLDGREEAQIRHALDYAQKHTAAGTVSHGQLLLIAKLAQALGLDVL